MSGQDAGDVGLTQLQRVGDAGDGDGGIGVVTVDMIPDAVRGAGGFVTPWLHSLEQNVKEPGNEHIELLEGGTGLDAGTPVEEQLSVAGDDIGGGNVL